MLHRISCVSVALVLLTSASSSQQLSSSAPIQPGTLPTSQTNTSTEPESKRIFGIIPNYRTSPSLNDFEPLTPGEKFKIASEDAFDRGGFALAALFGAEAQLTNSNRSFGQGIAGFGKYFATSWADFTIGDYMTEGIFPTVLHQDPRYFRRGTGSGWSRLGYAMGQIFWTRGDSGETEFNYSEVIGNSAAVAISNAYYSDNRTASDAVSKLGLQLGVDMAANILKEFWPEFEHKFNRKHRRDAIATDQADSVSSRH